ncbi:hypothetical protein NPIL_352431 [Nephila pilipes]|uniref:Uncharacterized protein n=1 Tax=Nephila pilipes TaxID=299642 RepID=A0A8X6PZP5_NEPPI|nr:hypothetical protein NPIL_352431 [Nephila pilipes]
MWLPPQDNSSVPHPSMPCRYDLYSLRLTSNGVWSVRTNAPGGMRKGIDGQTEAGSMSKTDDPWGMLFTTAIRFPPSLDTGRRSEAGRRGRIVPVSSFFWHRYIIR